jgi:hypothetical protein
MSQYNKYISFLKLPEENYFPRGFSANYSRSIDSFWKYGDEKITDNYTFIFKDRKVPVRSFDFFESSKVTSPYEARYLCLWGEMDLDIDFEAEGYRLPMSVVNMYSEGLDEYLKISMRLLGPNSFMVVRKGIRTLYTHKSFTKVPK